jgi:uncharacterized membrane protein YtjA (UPF0391 family)
MGSRPPFYRAKSAGAPDRSIAAPFSAAVGHAIRGTFVPAPDCLGEGSSEPHIESNSQGRGRVMLGWVVTFLVIALIAGILGFGGIAGASIEIAKIIFFIAVVLFLVSAIVGLARGRTRV